MKTYIGLLIAKKANLVTLLFRLYVMGVQIRKYGLFVTIFTVIYNTDTKVVI